MGTVISTATTNFSQALTALVQKKLQENLRAPLPHLLPGNFAKAEFVKGTNNTMRFLSIGDMLATAAEDVDPVAGNSPWLTEGTPPTSEDLVFGFEEFSANQAGRVIKLTDKAMLQHPADLLATAAERVVRNALETADRRVARVISQGVNVLYANTTAGAARLDVGQTNVLTADLLRRAVAILKQDNIPAFEDGYYRLIQDPFVSYDFQSDTSVGGWLDAQRYAGSMPLLTGEIGRFAGVRFIESPAAKIFADGGTTIIGGNTTAVAATDVITTSVAHNLVLNQKVRFRTISSGGAGLVAGTVYFVKTIPSSTTLTISATAGGATLDITSDLVTSTFGKVNNVHSLFLQGPGAYAFGDWGSIETHLTPPGGQSDPLHQQALVGWKGYFGAMLVTEGANSANMAAQGPRYIRIEAGSALG